MRWRKGERIFRRKWAGAKPFIVKYFNYGTIRVTVREKWDRLMEDKWCYMDKVAKSECVFCIAGDIKIALVLKWDNTDLLKIIIQNKE